MLWTLASITIQRTPCCTPHPAAHYSSLSTCTNQPTHTPTTKTQFATRVCHAVLPLLTLQHLVPIFPHQVAVQVDITSPQARLSHRHRRAVLQQHGGGGWRGHNVGNVQRYAGSSVGRSAIVCGVVVVIVVVDGGGSVGTFSARRSTRVAQHCKGDDLCLFFWWWDGARSFPVGWSWHKHKAEHKSEHKHKAEHKSEHKSASQSVRCSGQLAFHAARAHNQANKQDNKVAHKQNGTGGGHGPPTCSPSLSFATPFATSSKLRPSVSSTK